MGIFCYTRTMAIHIGTDHAGFLHKEEIKQFLLEAGFEVIDHGAGVLDENDDFTDFIIPTAQAVASEGVGAAGIIFGGSGQGEAMAANRIPGVRAAVYYGGPESIITLSREHNDANILSIGARFVSIEETKNIVQLWLQTNFSKEERHIRRIAKLDAIEN